MPTPLCTAMGKFCGCMTSVNDAVVSSELINSLKGGMSWSSEDLNTLAVTNLEVFQLPLTIIPSCERWGSGYNQTLSKKGITLEISINTFVRYPSFNTIDQKMKEIQLI